MCAEATTSLPSIQGIDKIGDQEVGTVERQRRERADGIGERAHATTAAGRAPAPSALPARGHRPARRSSSRRPPSRVDSSIEAMHVPSAAQAFGTHLAFCTTEEVRRKPDAHRSRCATYAATRPDAPKRTWLVYLLLGLFAAMLFSRSGPSGNRISYSDFKQRLDVGPDLRGRDRQGAHPRHARATRKPRSAATAGSPCASTIPSWSSSSRRRRSRSAACRRATGSRRCSWSGCCRCCCSAASGCSSSAA